MTRDTRNEIRSKVQRVRELLDKKGVDGLRLKSVDWFAWATAGGDSSVIFSNETGIAEVLITRDHAWVLTNAIEKPRLASEQVPKELEMVSFPWADAKAIDRFVASSAKRVASDRPIAGESAIDFEWRSLKLDLGEEELVRYKALGHDAAAAATEALSAVSPSMTEWELAGLAARACWKRGIHPLLTLVSGEERGMIHRHPVATNTVLNRHAMLVICGRRHGLFANLTRHVYFRDLTDQEKRFNEVVAKVEAEAFRATRERLPLGEIYDRLAAKYAQLGHADEIKLHHQGGPCGYLSREAIAGIDDPSWPTLPSRAYAWNPSLPGAKIEDTVFFSRDGRIEPLTVDPHWPTFEHDGLKRPDVWVKG